MPDMNKLKVNGNSYYNELRKPFNGVAIPNDMLCDVKEFAYNMCFGEGHHRFRRTGGQFTRKAGEQFCNTFQGKLAEVVLRKAFIGEGLSCSEPDFNVFGIGIWDDVDLIVNEKKISVKSAAHFSNLLLLESHDYDENGNYIPNIDTESTASYDFYVLVRIKPDIKGIFKNKRLMYSNNISIVEINQIINSQEWYYDVAGLISHDEFVSTIKNRNIIPQNAFLNGKIRMDADNYYVQSGDMHEIIELYKLLKAKNK